MKIKVKLKNKHMKRRRNMILILVILSIVLTASITYVSVSLFTVRVRESRVKVAQGSSALAADIIDGDKINKWFSDGVDDEYKRTYTTLKQVLDNTPDLKYLYVYQIREDGCHVVFDFDVDTVEGSHLGDFIEFDDTFLPLKETLLSGGRIDPIESNDSFGWLITNYEPICDSSGKCVAYAGADVSMT